MSIYKPNFNPESLPPYLQRMERLSRTAHEKNGIAVIYENYAQAKKFRQAFYSARNDMNKKIPWNNSIMWQVETKIEEKDEKWLVYLTPVENNFANLEIIETNTGRKVEISASEGESILSEDDCQDEIFQIMEEISILLPSKRKLGPEEHKKRNMLLELRAKDLWSQGYRAGNPENVEKLLRKELDTGKLEAIGL